MKKIVMLLLLFCSSCMYFTENDNKQICSRDKFVNPVFYELMYPYSRNLWQNKITETEVVETNADGYTVTYKCKLLCGTETFVSLDCSEQSGSDLIYTYSVRSKAEQSEWHGDEDEIEIDFRKLRPCPHNECYDGFAEYAYNYDFCGKKMIGEERSWGILYIKTPQLTDK